jgi:hypothetical protein
MTSFLVTNQETLGSYVCEKDTAKQAAGEACAVLAFATGNLEAQPDNADWTIFRVRRNCSDDSWVQFTVERRHH